MTAFTSFTHHAGSTGQQAITHEAALFPQPSGRITLSNSHRIAYQEFGARNGYPMLYFHDNGSSRLECTFFHTAAKAFGYRLIAIDRPGIGCSSNYSNPTPDTVAEDALELANCLKIDQFAVLSLGSGGIFALNLAQRFENRVSEVIFLGGVPGSCFREAGHGSRLSRCWSRLVPWTVQYLMRLRHFFLRLDKGRSVDQIETLMCESDRRAVASNQIRHILEVDRREALRQGCRGLAQDMANCYRKLKFTLDEVNVPSAIWQGKSDSLSQRTDCEFMQSRMREARYFRVPNRGHFFFLGRMDSVFSRMQGHAPDTQPMARQAAA